MSYHVYTTPGIILKRRVFGESDTVLYILTKDLGLIIASAKSTRVMASKLRNGLQEYSLATVSCIKGKNGWKVTNVSSDKNLFFGLKPKSQKILAQISSVLLKNITGEFPQKDVFNTVLESFSYLEKVEDGDLKDFEAVAVLRIMGYLGYVAIEKEFEKYFDQNLSVEDKINASKMERSNIIGVINNAIKVSQL